MQFHLILVGLGALALSACGLNDKDFANEEQAALNVFSRVDDLSISVASGIPTTDSARYEGYAGATNWNGDAIVGEMAMTVDFATDDIGGTMFGFVDTSDTNFDGSLTISNGAIDRSADPLTEYQFIADVDGVLSGGNDSTLVEAVMLGDFRGTTYGGVLGVLEGTATSRLGTAELSDDNSFFAAERR